MAERDGWLMGALAADDAYRGDDPPWPEPTGMGSVLGMGALVPPPRNPAAPPQGVVDMFVPNLSRSETYAPRSAELQPNAAGKVPTSDPLTTGAMSDLANMAGYAIPGPGGAAKAASILGLGVGRRLAVPAEEAAAKGIRAYHSSPHDFERFDASKIGTGEGAQVYGHGIYFAENPAVSGQGGQYWQQFHGRMPNADTDKLAAYFLSSMDFDRAKAIRHMREIDPPQFPDARARFDEALQKLESGKPVGPRTYEVNIDARPEQMLDWDKPLAQQPGNVRDVMGDVIGPRVDTYGNMRARFYSPMDEILRGTEAGRFTKGENYFTPGAVNIDAVRTSVGPEKAAQIDALLAKHQKDMEMSGADAYRSVSQKFVGPELASQQLREAGIPGIKYLDQGSRNAGDWHITPPSQTVSGKWMVKSSDYNSKGMHFDTEDAAKAALAQKMSQRTSNYVMFPGTEDRIKILKKYGIAGAVPTMGALAAADQYGYRQ